MYKLGLKLWSTNKHYFAEAKRLYEQGMYDYVELYVVPNSYDLYKGIWTSLKVPYVIHAPHYKGGLNLADYEKDNTNKELIQETLKYATALSAQHIIFHPGIAGHIEETARQLKHIRDHRILIENKPYFALEDGLICNGATREELQYVLQEVGCGFCLDIGHAICAANALQQEPLMYVKKMMQLQPKMYHLADGDFHSVYDKHDHFNQGDFPLADIFKILPLGAQITVESRKDVVDKLDDFVRDLDVLNTLSIVDNTFIITPARASDVYDIYDLANDPIVRQNSWNAATIAMDDHLIWFTGKLRSTDYFFIIKDLSHNLLGQLRLEKSKSEEGVYVVSISVAPAARGKGIGNRILKIISEKFYEAYHPKRLDAYIKHTNIGSIRTFEQAGYTLLKQEDVRCHYAFQGISHV